MYDIKNNKNNEFFIKLDKIFSDNLVKESDIRGNGWKVNTEGSLKVEPLYLDLITRRTGVILNMQTIATFVNEYLELFDDEFNKFLGWAKPANPIELLEFIEELLRKELVLSNHLYYLIKYNDKIIGVLYLYNYSTKHRKANLTIGLKKEYRGKKFAASLTTSVINNFMGSGTDSLLVRLGIEIETTNEKSLKLMEHTLTKKGFKREGLLRNNYGVNIDCHVYSYCIT